MLNLTIFERIKNRRKELNLSADEVAAALGVSRATVYRYESSDIEKLPATLLDPLSKILKCTPAYLMGWEDKFSKESSFFTVTIIETPELKNLAKIYLGLNEIGRSRLMDNANDLSKIYSK